MQPTSIAPNAFTDASDQTLGAPKPSEQSQAFGITSSVPINNVNTPVFDFGNSEWSDYLQANELLDSNMSLPQLDSVDPYVGFDIPFWLGQDQYWDMLHDRT